MLVERKQTMINTKELLCDFFALLFMLTKTMPHLKHLLRKFLVSFRLHRVVIAGVLFFNGNDKISQN